MAFGKVASPLPKAQALRDLLEGLLGRQVELLTGGPMVDPAGPGGAVVAEYVSDVLGLHALIVLDVPAAAHFGASLALMPAGVSQDDARQGELSDTLFEATGEVLNVCAALFNLEGAPHLRLGSVHAPNAGLPADVEPWVMAYVARLDVTVDVQGYGAGAMSVLIVP
ncbi:hypothetical protein [Timonella senegalensis]|uniref:hypothetical protein n=1 Tax=Timonella senegalensis TaxID=1465825 RepID=UPI0002EA3873|nr:hypothetical protein [Timonella senegalensis]